MSQRIDSLQPGPDLREGNNEYWQTLLERINLGYILSIHLA